MKIVICGSMKVCRKMIEVKKELKKLGHTVLLPRHAEEYARGNIKEEDSRESINNKIEGDLIRGYYEDIKMWDALLVVNEELKGVSGYIGGNTFLEMGFAHVLNKKIFLLNEIPEMGYKDEIVAMQPTVLKGDLNKIV